MFKKNWKYSNIILNKSYKLKEQNLLRLDCTKVLKQINWKIILMPKQIIDYVVIHELCHIIHFNHSKLFWEEVSNFCPEYKSHKNWLKNNFSILDF